MEEESSVCISGLMKFELPAVGAYLVCLNTVPKIKLKLIRLKIILTYHWYCKFWIENVCMSEVTFSMACKTLNLNSRQ